MVVTLAGLSRFYVEACDDDKCKPRQVHLTFGPTAYDIVVMWVTKGLCDNPSQVVIGNADIRHDQVSEGSDWVEKAEIVHFAGPSNKESTYKYIHKATLRYLDAGTRYHYKPVSSGCVPDDNYFTVPQLYELDGQSGTVEWSFLVLSDDLDHDGSVALLQEIAYGHKYTAVLHTGNMGNLAGHGGQNADTFFNNMEGIISTVPLLTAPGKQEKEGGNYEQYRHRLSMPTAEWPMARDKLWWSMDIGPVHIISFNTNEYFEDGDNFLPEQYDWLTKDLKNAAQRRDAVPWIVAFGHEPLYCALQDEKLPCSKTKRKDSPLLKGKLNLEDLFYGYGVDLVVTSYGRGYEMTKPMYKDGLKGIYENPKGPVYVVNPGADNYWDDVNPYEYDESLWLGRHTNDMDFKKPMFGQLHIEDANSLTYTMRLMENDRAEQASIHIRQRKHGGFKKNN